MACDLIKIAPQALVRWHRDDEVPAWTKVIFEVPQEFLVFIQVLTHVERANEIEPLLEGQVKNVALDQRALELLAC